MDHLYYLSFAFVRLAVLRLRGLIYHVRVFFSTKARKKYYLFIATLWSPARKGLTSWLSYM